jgi:uncharacterized protein
MNVQQLLNSITPDVYQQLKRAIEIGKGLDGTKLTPEQRQLCMQAVIAYEKLNLPVEEHTGYIPVEPHSYCGDEENHSHTNQDKPIRWVE